MNTKAARFWLFFGFLVLSLTGNSAIKSIGVPSIQNFSRKIYRASTQNWGVAQDSRGFMYFANNDGLLEYDGTYWTLFQFAEPALTRSVAIGNNGTIYVGMYNEFGAVKPDDSGKLTFTSFRKLLPDTIPDIGDVWKVHATPLGIFFQTYTNLFLFDSEGKLFQNISAPGNFRFSFFINNKLYIQQLGTGLLQYNSKELIPLAGFEALGNTEIWALLPGRNGNLIVGTSKNGVYTYANNTLQPWKNTSNEILKASQIFSACLLENNAIAFGTIQNGVIITSDKGDLLQHLNHSNGLQNNTILSVTTDKTGSLWLGLDNGIDYAEVNSAFTFLYHPDGFGTGYTAQIYNGYLYLGTNNGLFSAAWPPLNPGQQGNHFTLIPNTVGQVWYLGVHEDILLCGHDNGTFEIKGLVATKISDNKGAWKFINPEGKPGILIGGNYQGLSLFNKNRGSNSWRFVKQIPGFSESSRVIEQDNNGNIWMTHGFKGAYKIQLNELCDSVLQFYFYNTSSGFPTNNYINVYKYDNNLIFTAREGIYRYNSVIDRFEADDNFRKMFGTSEHISYLKQDKSRNIWYVAGNKPGVLRYHEDGRYTNITAPYEILHDQMIGGFEFIYPNNENDVFFGIEGGFAHYSPLSAVPPEVPFITYIRQIKAAHPDTILFGGDRLLKQLSPNSTDLSLLYKKNTIQITYSAPRHYGKRVIEYSFMLENFNDEWSAWTTSTACEYSNLPEGTYVYSVKARDVLGNISQPDSFTFKIKPPWYRTSLARFCYLILLVIMFLALIWGMVKRIEISQRKERLKHLREYRAKEQIYQREALKAEKEIINLRNEKLRVNMIHRDKELANQTLHLIQKNKFLLKMKEEMRKMTTLTYNDTIVPKLNQLIRKIDKDIDNDNQWEVFETAFDEVHEEFLNRLKLKFPELSPKELRLCAYLRLNISSKEIAALMNISTRGVEISRYRLRKKLFLEHDTNLIKFIMEL